MKKQFLAMVGIVALLAILNCDSPVSAYSCSSTETSITTPDMKSSSSTPGCGDTYFTYYSEITGYRSNGLWGFYSKTNRSVNIPAMYTDIEGLNSHYIKVKQNGRWGLISTEGYQLIAPIYSSISTFSIGGGEYFQVGLNGNSGIIDANGNILVPIQYQTISRLNSSYLNVKRNGLHAIYSIYEGREIIDPKYDAITMLEPYFMVKENGGWGLIDANDKFIVQPRYDDIKILNTAYFAVKDYKMWGVVNKTTVEEIIAPTYDKIEYGRLNYFKVKRNSKWGAVDYTGKVVIPIVNGPFEINKLLKKLN